jgi:type 1 glutamine amidotransferase
MPATIRVALNFSFANGIPMKSMMCGVFALLLVAGSLRAADPWVTYSGGDGPGAGKKVVLISGDEEYRSEEALPQLGKILAKHIGFDCTVLFAINPETGEIDPNNTKNIPGLETLADADLMIIATRFRDLPDDQMVHIDNYLKSGRPVIGMRTATHGFNLSGSSNYGQYHWRSNKEGWDGGFGRQILGETWINHHGQHGKQATRGIVAEDQAQHPILRGIKSGDLFGPTDVYGVRLPLPGDSQPLILGQVVTGMNESDPALEGKKNDPMMPVAWTKTYEVADGKVGRVLTTTMGASQDLSSEGVRRLLVNGALWAVGLEEKITPDLNVSIVGTYEPTKFGFGSFKKGVKPSDHAMTE